MDPKRWTARPDFGDLEITRACAMYKTILEADVATFTLAGVLRQWRVFRIHARESMMSLPMSGFWELYHASYGPTMPDLTALIRVLYCIMPSSVPCERIFSHVKLVWSHLRCQLQPVQVETLTRCWAYANAGMWSVNDSVTRFFASAGRGPRRPGAKDAERKPRSDKKPTVSAQEALECQPDVPLVPPTPSRKRKRADGSDEPRALLQSTLTFGTPVCDPPVDHSVEAPRFAPLSTALET